jgi:hypothetical protein
MDPFCGIKFLLSEVDIIAVVKGRPQRCCLNPKIWFGIERKSALSKDLSIGNTIHITTRDYPFNGDFRGIEGAIEEADGKRGS